MDVDNGVPNLFDGGEEASTFHAPPPRIPAYAFIIDCSEPMSSSSSNYNLILISLQAIRHTVREYIFAGNSRMQVAVILMGTEKFENSADANNIFVLFPMQAVGAEVMKKLDESINLASTDSFGRLYGSGNFCLSEALWIASSLLQERKLKLKKQTILFTNCSDPFKKPRERARCINKVAGFGQTNISFQLIPMGESSKIQPYKEILELAGSSCPVENGVKTYEEAAACIPGPISDSRPTFNINFFVTNDVSVPVNVSILASRTVMPYSQALCAETNAVVTTKVTLNSVDSDPLELEGDAGGNSEQQPFYRTSVVEPSQILHCERIAGKTIAFTPAEMSQITSFGAKELRLIGFKPKDCIPLELHILPCRFVYPTEDTAKGATTLFAALMQRCEAKGVVAFCSFCPGNSSTSRYVALAPSKEPEGFLMVFLPFGDEIRDLEVPIANPTPEQTNLMKDIVKKLRFPFSPQNFANPRLAAHWRAVEALALDLCEPDIVTDPTIPDYDMLAERLGDLPQRVMDEIYEGAFREKKSTTQKSDPMSDISAVTSCYRDGELKRLNVSQLRTFLTSVGRGQGLSKFKKADLICMVEEHLGK